MRKPRKLEGPEGRSDRLTREAQTKRDGVVAEDAAVDRMIRLNLRAKGSLSHVPLKRPPKHQNRFDTPPYSSTSGVFRLSPKFAPASSWTLLLSR